jgi:phosphoglycolate phosphatase
VTKALVFDLDGTLVDSLPGIAMSLNRALLAAGLATHSEEKVRTFIGDGAEMLVKRAVGTEVHRAEEVLAMFREAYATDWKAGTVPYAGIAEMLHALKEADISLAVLSNKPHAFTVEIVDALFPGVFAYVIGQRAGIPHKPDPAGLHLLLSEAGWGAGEVRMIGDSVMDIQTARAAGVGDVAVTWGYHDRAALVAIEPSIVVDQVRELHQLLLA